MKKFISTLLLAGIAASSHIAAATLDFTYNADNDDFYVYGNNKLETYDVAIKLDPSLAGSKITALAVPIPVNVGQVSNLTGWASTELKLVDKKNAPDLGSAPAVLDDWTLTVQFPEPIVIPAGGAYVGYSFTVDVLTTIDDPDSEEEAMEKAYPGTPVTVIETDGPVAGGLYLHTSRTVLRWTDFTDRLYCVSPLVVSLDGDFKAEAAMVQLGNLYYAAAGKKAAVDFTIANHGSEPVKSIVYSYSVGKNQGSGTYEFKTPVPAQYGATQPVDITIDALDETGDYDLYVSVDMINGVKNGDPVWSAKSQLKVLPFLPENHPLIEEYTGLWCGYCPTGYVAIEELERIYGHNAVVLSYHNDDQMAVIDDTYYPSDVEGFPTSFINRDVEEYPGDLVADYPTFASKFTPADFKAYAYYTDETRSEIAVSSETTFVQDDDDYYYVAFALVADNLHNARWRQSNYFSGDTDPELTGDLWDIFTKGESYVTNLPYNSVVVSFPELHYGYTDSEIEMPVAGQKYKFETTLDATNLVNLDDDTFINDDATFRVVAVLMNYDGEIINSWSTPTLTDLAGVGSLGEDKAADVVKRVYFDMQGRRIAEPANGLYIEQETYNDGSIRNSKRIR